jgi:Carboxypeptidase regulatory-like domain
MIERTRWKQLIGLGVFSLLMWMCQAAAGQAVNGTLLGTVTDSSGAAVPNARVTIKQISTNSTHEALTNGSGNYTFPDLRPGAYSVTAESTGFKKATQENVQLLSNSSIRVDITMQPGNVTETVTVTTAPPVLQTDRADISTKIDATNVMALPLTTGRNFQSLLNLVPGTSPATFQHSQFFNAQNSLQTQANGMPRVSNL